MRYLCLVVCTVLCCFVACVNRVQTDKPWGEQARVWLKDGTVHDGELLAVTATSLLFADQGSRAVSDIPLTSIKRVHVRDYSQMGLRVAGMVPTVLVYSAAAAVLATVGSWWSLIPILAASGSVWTFLADDPKVRFGPDFDSQTIVALRVYCRYPYGLTDEQQAIIKAAGGGSRPQP